MQNNFFESTNIDNVIYNAAIKLSAIMSIPIEEAENRIKEKTGFPAEESQKDNTYERLSWDSYFMSLAFLVSMRSPDSQTQHGCVIVDQNNGIVSTGYNGWLQGAFDESMPNTRPKKYQHIIHSEINAVLAAEQRNLNGYKAYITGLPCNECLKVLARKGIKEIIIGDRPHVFAEGYFELHCLICAMHNIQVRKFTGKLAFLDGRKISENSHGKMQ